MHYSVVPVMASDSWFVRLAALGKHEADENYMSPCRELSSMFRARMYSIGALRRPWAVRGVSPMSMAAGLHLTNKLKLNGAYSLIAHEDAGGVPRS